MTRVYNFFAGPATLPLEALETARDEMLEYADAGASIMELSHRGKHYDAVHNEAIQLCRELLSVPDNYKILFFQGGATLQFSQIPMNLLKKSADYVLTGAWAEKAFKAAQPFGEAQIAASTKDAGYNAIPAGGQLKLNADADYVHICSNNTIYGTQFRNFPSTGSVPLIADMSSDIMSRVIDVPAFDMIYAGAQKNMGPSGVVLVIISDALLDRCDPADTVPPTMRYKTIAEKNSLLNTPPTFAIYMLRNVYRWLKNAGGVAAIEEHNEKKAALIYDAINADSAFYKGHAMPESRSRMNITFNLPSAELEAEFVKQAAEQNMIGLKGHRSIGGIRASIYNAMPMEGCQALADFMKDFVAKKG